jgi:hypothetical protein
MAASKAAWRIAVALSALHLLGVCLAQEENVKPLPLPAGKGAYVRRNYNDDCLKWGRAFTVEAYRQIGLKNPAWDEGVFKLLELYCQFRIARANFQDLCAAGEPLVKAGCNDPLVLYIVGEAVWESGRPAEAEPLAIRALEGFKTVPYSKAIAWDAPVTLREVARRLGKEDAAKAATELSLQWLAQAAAEPAVQAANRRPFWRYLTFRLNDDYQYRLRQEAYAALQAQPNADPWLVDMVGGEYRLGVAWEARGEGFADTVTEEAGKIFEDNLTQARTCYTRAWRVHPEYPEAATRLISIAGTDGEGAEGECRKWFDRAVAAQFDYTGAYDSYAWALDPRWGGSFEQMLAFGAECLATGRFDTDVPWYYLDAVYSITNDDHATSYWDKPEVWDGARQVCQGYANAQGEFADRVVNWRSREASLAWRTRHYREALALMKDLGQRLNRTYFEAFNVTMAWVWGQVMCMSCNEGPKVQRAEVLYEAGDLEPALAAFKPMAALLGAPESQVYLNGRIVCLEKEIALARGEWAPLQPDAALTGWHRVWGDWTVGGDGTLQTTSPRDTFLACRMRAGEAYEIAGTIEVPGDGSQANAGVIVGLDLSGKPYWSTLQLVGKDGEAQWCHHFRREAGVKLPRASRYEVVLRVEHGQATAVVNGQQCFQGEPLYTSVAEAPGLLVGFGAEAYEGDAGVKYRDFRLRKLTAPPANPAPLPAGN